jgi:short-subunit dehydrogenase
MARQTVLITGASSGIGWELAVQFAQAGYDMVLLARGRHKLEALAAELKQRFGTSADVIEADLSQPQALNAVAQALAERALRVDVLVNNAGFGLLGAHADLDAQRQMDMIQLNIGALVGLTRLLLPGMRQRGAGGVLNVASTAAFQAGPYMAVYYATKAFVLSYTEALHEELAGTGVHVSCLCPGPTETGFVAAAQMEGSKLFKTGVQTPSAVAHRGYRAFQRNQTIAISGYKNLLLALAVKFSPRAITRKIAGALNR